MFIANCNRKALLNFLPKGGHVAEVGVKRGNFSRVVKARVKPEKFHLIDPWGKDDSDEYLHLAVETKENTEGYYQAVLAEFQDSIKDGSVIVQREYSYEATKQIPDGYFDWVFIDALHTYEPVLMDLRAFDAKVKADGFILGHDFARSRKSTKHKYGVVEAVETFLKERPDYELVLITNEDYPSFLIAKSPKSERTRTVIDRLMAGVDFLVKVNDPFGARYRQDTHEFVRHNADGSSAKEMRLVFTLDGGPT